MLQLRGRLSAEALAQEFEVSVRTIYRDIDQLSAAGVPVYAERGRSGGFALHEGYRTRLTGFTPAEAEALLLAGAGPAASDLGIGAEAAAAQLKLLASLPPDAGASAQHIASRFHLDPADWYARDEKLDFLPTLANAVWREQRVRIRYESWNDVVTRELDPLGLVLKAGRWYLVAANKGKPRTYRASNIQSIETLDTKAARPPRFDLARHWAHALKEFDARLMRERAVVKLSPEGRRLLGEVSPAAAEAVNAKHTSCKPAGWIKAEVPFEDSPHGLRQFLRIGSEIEVLEPATIRSKMTAETQKLAKLYTRRR
jgi:predicted DNA-binding transcriptional regulator YafY